MTDRKCLDRVDRVIKNEVVDSMRINLIVLGDGYKEGKDFMDKYQFFLELFGGEDWFNERIATRESEFVDEGGRPLTFGNFFHIQPITAISNESGVGVDSSCDGFDPVRVDNAFGSRFSHGRNLESEGNVPFRILRGDVGKVKKYLYPLAKWDYVLVLSNTEDMDKKFTNEEGDDKFSMDKRVLRGGYADTSNKIAWVSANANDWFSLAMHELGHVIFNLHEEYDYYSGDGNNADYLGEDGIPESNIMPTRRIEYLLEELRHMVLQVKNIKFAMSDNGKDYQIGAEYENTFNEGLEELLSEESDSQLDSIGFSNRERMWFKIINLQASNRLFDIVEPHHPIFKKNFKLVHLNVFWKKFSNDDLDNAEEELLYYRSEELKEAISNNFIGFYEGAGTFEFGMARPMWTCRMRETRSEEQKEDERVYLEKVKEYLSPPKSKPAATKPGLSTSDRTDSEKPYCKVCEQSIRQKLLDYIVTDNIYESTATQGIEEPVF